MTTGEKIKSIRIREKLTQADFSDKIHVSRSNLAQIETGKSNPTFITIASICEEFNIEPSFFFDIKVEAKLSGDENVTNLRNNYVTGKDKNPVSTDNIDANSNKSNPDLEQNDSIITSKNQSKIVDKSYVLDIDAPFYLEGHVQKKVLLELLKGNNERAKLYQNINTLMNFQYIIMNLDHYYFENIDKKEHEVSKYYNGKSFDYEAYRDNILKEIDKYLGFNAPLTSLVAAINDFYKKAKEADTENIIEGYFNQIKP
ncbi:MAG: helix-turn-helix domain-containing protein [Bacteroidetes bacterium]|nr:helix-turn-helix domain-containing protein [Bacteroidota bacterium]MBU1373853.1 helix-turn-helix domain-containing protein [Bacteroidota bacterium]MBU1483959.1 helix-turn-helix domain-containing protein [Bacteroidota bacterium]MBU1761159.1 helix-turn-helix domain-containing protein [Bacteroidota bacterium]MBU2047190.1 helix-turn-helix domain-containing protein [Bacteroidota bacterium]